MRRDVCRSADLHPLNDTTRKLVKSVSERRGGREKEAIYRATDHRILEGSGSWRGREDLCRKHGFSDAAFYGWRSKFGGMQVAEAKRLRELESENAKLKKLLAEAHLDVEALKVAFG